jgi:putative transposase
LNSSCTTITATDHIKRSTDKRRSRRCKTRQCPKHNRVRLSKGANHKDHPRDRDYIIVEYETRPGISVENLQQVRAVYDNAKERWELHLVCKAEIETPDAPGEETAGIDLGISNFAAVAYSTEEADLYPGELPHPTR